MAGRRCCGRQRLLELVPELADDPRAEQVGHLQDVQVRVLVVLDLRGVVAL